MFRSFRDIGVGSDRGPRAMGYQIRTWFAVLQVVFALVCQHWLATCTSHYNVLYLYIYIYIFHSTRAIPFHPIPSHRIAYILIIIHDKTWQKSNIGKTWINVTNMKQHDTTYNMIWQNKTLRHVTARYVAVHCIALHCIALHCMTLHDTSLYCIASRSIT